MSPMLITILAFVTVTGVMAAVSIDASVTGVSTMSRLSWYVQPVSSYGRGLPFAYAWSEKYISASVRYGWSARMM